MLNRRSTQRLFAHRIDLEESANGGDDSISGDGHRACACARAVEDAAECAPASSSSRAPVLRRLLGALHSDADEAPGNEEDAENRAIHRTAVCRRVLAETRVLPALFQLLPSAGAASSPASDAAALAGENRRAELDLVLAIIYRLLAGACGGAAAEDDADAADDGAFDRDWLDTHVVRGDPQYPQYVQQLMDLMAAVVHGVAGDGGAGGNSGTAQQPPWTRWLPLTKCVAVLRVLMGAYLQQLDSDGCRHRWWRDRQRAEYRTVHGVGGLPPAPRDAHALKAYPHDYQQCQDELAAKYPTAVLLEMEEQADVDGDAQRAALDLVLGHYPFSQTALRPDTGESGTDEYGMPLSPSGDSYGDSSSAAYKPLSPLSRMFEGDFMAMGPVPAAIRESLHTYRRHLYIPLGMVQVSEAVRQMRVQVPPSDGLAGRSQAGDNHTDTHRHAPTAFEARYQDFYETIMPKLNGSLIVLLKVLLACAPIPRPDGYTHPPGSTIALILDLVDAECASDGSRAESHLDEAKKKAAKKLPASSVAERARRELEAMAYRDIVAASITDILLWLLKHARNYHALMFEHVSQMLLDGNALLLLLKILNQDPTAVVVKHDGGNESVGEEGGAEPQSQSSNETTATAVGKPLFKSLNAAVQVDASTASEASFQLVVNCCRLLQKLTKRKSHGLYELLQMKAYNIVKRVVKLEHPLLNRYVYKLLRPQIPYMNRLWRQSNMKLITGVYVQTRPHMRETWIEACDSRLLVEQSQVSRRYTLALIKHYTSTRFPEAIHRHSMAVLNVSTHSVVDDEALLDDEFKANYREWLEREVYQTPLGQDTPYLATICAKPDESLLDNQSDFAEEDREVLDMLDDLDLITSDLRLSSSSTQSFDEESPASPPLI